jgi:hypothetical protein
MTDTPESDGFITVHPKPKRQPVQSWHVGVAEFVIYINGEPVARIPRRAYPQLMADLAAHIARSQTSR